MDLPMLDLTSALKRLEGDRELYTDLVNIFREDASELWRRAEAAPARDELVSGIHRLQNVAASIGALKVAACASAIVELARQGQVAEARHRLPALREELNRVEAALASL